jgi:lipopolysaccharide transport system permease protein
MYKNFIEFSKNIRELYSYRELLYNFTLRDIRIRYKQTFFGAAWAVLQPFIMMIVLNIVFGRFVQVSTDNIPYPVFSYCALVPWTFFSNSISMATNSLIGNIPLVTKVYFPREILPFASAAAFLLDFLIAFIMLVVLMVTYKVKISIYVLFSPLLLVILMFLIFSVSLFSSALNVKFRDIKYVVPLSMQIWMYLTPVIYSLNVIPKHLQWVYLINPMSGIVHSFRNILLEAKAPNVSILFYSAGASLFLFLVAYYYFKKSEKWFADII